MKKLFTVLLILFFNQLILKSQPVFIKSISKNSKEFIAIGNQEFYISGDSLMKSNGTSVGTVLVKSGLKTPSHLTNANGKVYFVNNPQCISSFQCFWKEIWVSDGTTAGTKLLKSFSKVAILNSIGNTVMLAADDNVKGTELWKSDGTSVGTTLVKDIYPGANGSMEIFNDFSEITGVYNNQLLFAANNGTQGNELWRSDGTTGGTYIIKDIQPGPDGSDPSSFQLSGGVLYFATINSEVPVEIREPAYNKLWRTNGTGANTLLLKNFGSDFGYTIGSVIDINGTLFFTLDYLQQTPYSTVALWKSKGTAANTVLVKNTNGGYWYNIVNVNGILVASVNYDGTGGDLYRSDGTNGGTFIFYRTENYEQIIDLASINNILFFNAVVPTGDIYANYDQNVELWRSDLTEEGTAMVKDLYPSLGLSMKGADHFINVNRTLFFTTNDLPNDNQTPTKLWKYSPELFAVSELTLVNLNPGTEIRAIKDVDTLFTDQHISLIAKTTGPSGSVKFLLNDNVQRVESIKPYSFAGDGGGNYTEWNKVKGFNKITVIPYSAANATGIAGLPFNKLIYVLAPEDTVKAASVTFTLVSASTFQDIKVLKENDVIIYNSSIDKISIKAIPNKKVGSIEFILDGGNNFLENSAPYSLRGDVNGQYHPWNASYGFRTLTAIGYSGPNKTGTVLFSATIHFTVQKPASLAKTAMPSAYPNPISEKISVNLDSDIEQEVQIRIYDMNGNYIYNGSHNVFIGSNTVSIDLSEYKLKPGIYLLKIIQPYEEERVLKLYSN